ncbi:hypothetical protein EJB05_41330 [Eragrostis curvula]|uniref:RING-type E3 ubiquitin transferase n=1 Tax=Eragrostis curvula TaxID=38414 RepID=A0A5J9T9F5_9POAL|nr:hypothetical protein EJB05_41330 [Eragrostis curvula]
MDSSSSTTSSGGGPQVAVAVRGDGRGSRRAARWANASLFPSAGRVALVHVIPPLAFVPTPSGERVPVEKLERQVVEMYAEDRLAREQEVFLPFRRLCGRRPVDTVVLEGDSVAEALVRYAADSGVRSLVLGSASLSWFRRMLRLRDVPATVLKTMPSSCNVFVVSRRKLTIKFANQARTSKLNTIRIQSISHNAFDQKQRDWFQDKQSRHNVVDGETSNHSGNTSLDSCSQACSSLSTSAGAVKSSESHGRGLSGSLGRKTPGRDGSKDYGAICQSKNVPYVALSSVEECQPIDEVAKLRKELKDTLTVYGGACKNLVHANEKIQLFSTECCEDVKRIHDALQREKMLKQTVADEKTKHVAAVGAVKMANESLTHEAYSMHKAETVANMVSIEKAKVVDALLSSEWLTEYRDTVVAGTMFYMDPEYQLTGTVRPKSDLYALGIIILQLLTGKRPFGLILSVEEAIKKGTLSDILDKSQTDWPIAEAEMLARLGLRCTALKCRDRPNLNTELLPELEHILSKVTASLKLKGPNVATPSHFICPILQEIMEDPYIAADGHTYEQRAIKAWLRKHKISPVTKQKLPNSSIIPNHSLRRAIQQWKSRISQ